MMMSRMSFIERSTIPKFIRAPILLADLVQFRPHALNCLTNTKCKEHTLTCARKMATTEHEPGPTATLTSSNSMTTMAELHDHLDSLWISYLHNLSQYTEAQTLLQQRMSAGFLSLARANFTPRSGVRRYGKGYFSDRAVASKRALISTFDNDQKLKLDIVPWTDDSEDSVAVASSEPTKDSEDLEKSNRQQPSPPLTPADEIGRNDTDESKVSLNDLNVKNESDESKGGSVVDENNTTAKTKSSLDPLRWFGILVPPELRSAQASFISAIDESIADALNASKRMRELEVEIRKLRKDIRKAKKAVS